MLDIIKTLHSPGIRHIPLTCQTHHTDMSGRPLDVAQSYNKAEMLIPKPDLSAIVTMNESETQSVSREITGA